MLSNKTLGKLLVVVVGIIAAALSITGLSTLDTVPDSGKGALSRDAVYQGALTLTGLAVFGSLFTWRAKSLTNPDPHIRRPAAMVTLAAFALAGTQLMLAALMCCTDPGPILPQFIGLTVVFVAICVLGYDTMDRSREENLQ